MEPNFGWWNRWKGTVIFITLAVMGAVMQSKGDNELALIPFVGALVVIALDQSKQ